MAVWHDSAAAGTLYFALISARSVRFVTSAVKPFARTWSTHLAQQPHVAVLYTFIAIGAAAAAFCCAERPAPTGMVMSATATIPAARFSVLLPSFEPVQICMGRS